MLRFLNCGSNLDSIAVSLFSNSELQWDEQACLLKFSSVPVFARLLLSALAQVDLLQSSVLCEAFFSLVSLTIGRLSLLLPASNGPAMCSCTSWFGLKLLLPLFFAQQYSLLYIKLCIKSKLWWTASAVFAQNTFQCSGFLSSIASSSWQCAWQSKTKTRGLMEF